MNIVIESPSVAQPHPASAGKRLKSEKANVKTAHRRQSPVSPRACRSGYWDSYETLGHTGTILWDSNGMFTAHLPTGAGFGNPSQKDTILKGRT